MSAGAEKIVFFDYHHSPLTCHPWRKTKLIARSATANEIDDKKPREVPSTLDYEAKPDIVGTEVTVFEEYCKWDGALTGCNNYRNFPWHHVRTIVEIKSDTVDESERQTATYVGDLHQSRPDMAGAYGLYASSKDYSIHWGDCTGAYKSLHFPWSNLDPLIQFVESLYRPPQGHRDAHDQTVQLDLSHAEGGVFVPDDPRWRFPLLPGCSFCVIFVAPELSRGTRIFQQQNYPDEQKAPLIIKDVYVPKSGRRYREVEMLQRLHSGQKGPLEGCLRAMELKFDREVHTPLWPNLEARRKEWLLCFDTGKIIVQSPSILQFLEATFDSLEHEQFLAGCIHTAVLTEFKVHRAAFERGVLHRDVSPGNVYIDPLHVHIAGCVDLQGVKIPELYCFPASESPMFIGCILDRSQSCSLLYLYMLH